MEFHTCAYEPSNAYNSDYGKINIGSVIMCFLIIYSTALSIVLSVKQLIQVIKEEEEEEEVIEEEEEIIKEVEVEVIKEEDKEKNEEELLLANYNAKERALALQSAHDERATIALEKWAQAYHNLVRRSYARVQHHENIKRGIGPLSHGNYDNTGKIRVILEEEVDDYLTNEEKRTRLEALSASKKTNLLDELSKTPEFAVLFNT